jgi:hypothetical protein
MTVAGGSRWIPANMRSAVSDRRRDQISPGQRRRADLDERAALLALDKPLVAFWVIRNGVPPDGCALGIRRHIPNRLGSGGTLTMSIIRTTGTVGTTNHSDRHIDGAGGR